MTGKTGIEALAKARVIIFGVGGVGSWTAEALIRSGIGHLTIVDSDLVCITNINRQAQATTATIGQPKVDALKNRLLEINPAADIEAIEAIYDKETASQFDLDNYDYVIDAIDSLSCKLDLIANAVNADTTLYSSLGAACKLDPSRIRVASIWETSGCRLGRFVRKRLRNRGVTAPFLCVYSDELRPVQEGSIGCGTGDCVCPKRAAIDDDGDGMDEHEWCSSKQQINGSVVHITGIFGFTLCGLVMQDILKDIKDIRPFS